MLNSNPEFTNGINPQAVLEKLNRQKWEAQLNFEAYGTRISIRSDTIDTIENLERILPNILPTGWNKIMESAADFVFSIIVKKRKSKKKFFIKTGN